MKYPEKVWDRKLPGNPKDTWGFDINDITTYIDNFSNNYGHYPSFTRIAQDLGQNKKKFVESSRCGEAVKQYMLVKGLYFQPNRERGNFSFFDMEQKKKKKKGMEVGYQTYLNCRRESSC